MSLLDEINLIESSWKNIILDWINGEGKHHWEKLEITYKKDVEKFRGFLLILPYYKHIFRCFNHLNPNDIRVVILGQDPYHGLNQANGRCFAVEKNIKKPPSLINIEKELKNDVGSELEDITLNKWEEQGVLLLNASLTVRQGTPGSYMKLWKPFTEFIINYLINNYSGIVFVAWGAFAYDKFSKINESKNNHTLLVSSHPSPFSCARKFRDFPSFNGSKPFSKINTILESPINW